MIERIKQSRMVYKLITHVSSTRDKYEHSKFSVDQKKHEFSFYQIFFCDYYKMRINFDRRILPLG